MDDKASLIEKYFGIQLDSVVSKTHSKRFARLIRLSPLDRSKSGSRKTLTARPTSLASTRMYRQDTNTNTKLTFFSGPI